MARKESVIELKIQGTDKALNQLVKLKEQSKKFGDEIRNTRKEIKEYEKSGKDTKKLENKVNSLLKAQERLKKGIRDTNKEVRDSQRAWDAAKFPKDSIIGMEQAYSKLRVQIRGLSAEQRKSQYGKSLIKESRAIKDSIRQESMAFGDTYHSIGNYQMAIENALRGQGSFTGNMKALALNTAKIAAPMYAAVKGVQLLGAGLKDAIRITLKYEQANADLSAIMGITSEETKKLQVQSKELGGTTAFTATQVTGMQIEMAKLGFTMDEIMASGRGIVNFSVATGADIPRAAALAGAALRAFNLDATEMDRVVSTLGVATTKSGLDFAKLETSLSKVAPVANAFGFTIEDTIALMGKLADAGFEASVIGTSTRNIFLKMADANGELAKALGRPVNNLEELVAGMKELNSRGINLNETLHLTDKRSVAAMRVFLQTADSVTELRDSITDVNDELQVMADKRLDTVRGKVTLLKSAWEGLVLSVAQGSGGFSTAAKDLLDGATAHLRALTAYNEGLLTWQEANQTKNRLVGKGLGGKLLSTDELIAFRKKLRDEIEADKKTLYTGKTSTQGGIPFLSDKEKDQLKQEAKARAKVIEEANNEARLKWLKEHANDPDKGSISYLRQQITSLKKELESEVKDEKGIRKTLEQIAGYEKQLDKAENTLRKVKRELEGKGGKEKKVSALPTVDLIPDELKDKSISNAEEVFDKVKVDEKAFWKLQEEKEEELHRKRIAREEQLKQIKEQALRSIETVANGVFQIQAERIEAARNKELEAAQEVYDQKIKDAQGNVIIEEAAKRELEKKKEQIEKEAARKRKNIAYTEAVIQGALAIIKASPNVLLMAAAALTTAVNLAVIANTKFAKGGFTGKAAPGTKTDSTGHKPTATYTVHENEYIANAKMTERYNAMFKAMDKNDEAAIHQSMYAELKKSDIYKNKIGAMPGFFPHYEYRQQNKTSNKGIEERLDKLTEKIEIITKDLDEKVTKGVILGMDQGSRMIERKGYK